MRGLLGLHYLFSFLHGMSIVQTKVSAHIAHLVSTFAIPLSFHGLVGHVGLSGLLPLFLDFLGPFTLSLPLMPPMRLLAVILTMLAH